MKTVTMFVWNSFINDARVLREAKALSETYEVTIIAKKEKDERALKRVEKVHENVYVNRLYKWELPSLITKLVKSTILKKHLPNALLMLKMIARGRSTEADIYHAHDLNTLIQGVICAKLRKNQRPLIYDSHEVQTSRTHYDFHTIHKLEKFLLKFVDHVIVENDTRAAYHKDLYHSLPTALHNYSEYYDISQVEAVNLRKIYHIPKDKKIVLYQGGHQEGRGLFLLLEAMQEINNAHLIMIGDGKERENLIRYSKRLNLSKDVTFIPKIPYVDLRKYTKSADIGVQFLENTNYNHYSASSNKLFEYIMAHVPVVGVDFPEIEAVIKNNQVGLIVKHGDKKDLIDKIQMLVDNDAMRKEFSHNCKIAKEKYNWEVEKAVLMDVYQKIDKLKEMII